MPAATTLSRISRYDYFAILGSGTYVVGCVCFLGAAICNSGAKLSARATASWLSGEIQQHWPIAVGFLFLPF